MYLQGVGLAQVLFQAGLFCPARDAEMSIASGLYTHYQAEEKPQQQTGRFGEEAARLREILTRQTPTAVLLSNETFTSTGPGEAAYLMLDIVRVLVALGCRSLLATHLHELASWVEDEQVPGAFNLAATTREVPADGAARVVPTFRVERAPPAGHSHAADRRPRQRAVVRADRRLPARARPTRPARLTTQLPDGGAGKNVRTPFAVKMRA